MSSHLHGIEREFLCAALQVLCLARRFASAPQVRLTLVIIKDGQGNFDDRVQSALDVFKSSISEPSRVSISTIELDAHTREAVLEAATASQYDFIMMGHSKLDLAHGKEETRSVAPPLRRFTSEGSLAGMAGTPKRGPTSGLAITPRRGPTSVSASTPRRASKATKVGSVLGKMGRLLTSAGVQSSILVVHGANSFMESSSSLSMKVGNPL